MNFNTDGCKLLIEAFPSIDDVLIFTITKYTSKENNNFCNLSKRLTVKRKSINLSNQHAICSFDTFDNFCLFCQSITKIKKIDLKKLAKSFSLYFYHDIYYLGIKNINTNDDSLPLFYSVLSEFGKLTSYSNHFENKLLEHGKQIIKKDAINTSLKYFINEI